MFEFFLLQHKFNLTSNYLGTNNVFVKKVDLLGSVLFQHTRDVIAKTGLTKVHPSPLFIRFDHVTSVLRYKLIVTWKRTVADGW